MLKQLTRITLIVAFALTSVAFFERSASGQSPAARPDSPHMEAAAPQGPRSGNPEVAASAPNSREPENKVAADVSRSNEVEVEVAAMKAETATVRELLIEMQEREKQMLETVDRLQQRLNGTTTADAQPDSRRIGPPTNPGATVPATNAADEANASQQSAFAETKQGKEDLYQDGIVLGKTSDDAKVPFLLKFNMNTQLRYLNTLSSEATFTDHLGVVRDVHVRNDITVNRAMFHFRRIHFRQQAAI